MAQEIAIRGEQRGWLPALRDRIERVFNRWLSRHGSRAAAPTRADAIWPSLFGPAGFGPAVDVINEDDQVRVVAELPRNGDTAPAGLVAALDGRARLVVADLQEGTAAAEAVGERLGVPVVVLSAFPGVPGYGSAYEELLQNNLRRLEGPWQRSESPSRR